ncbi:MAG: helix-turn-helix domain-containing protein [Saprospiraceae bacterium]
MSHHLAVIVTDANKKIQWVNEDFLRITGYSLQEVLGKKPGDLLQGPLSEPEVVKRIRHGLEGHVPIVEEITNYRKNGEAYTCRLAIHPIFDEYNKLTNFIAFEADMGEVKGEMAPALQMKTRYLSSSLKGSEGAELFNALKRLLEEEKSYLDPKLSLKTLADLLHSNTKYLSQVVNLHFGDNLQAFLNHFRVEEAKRRLAEEDSSTLTLYGIAMQCGFRNKSTFYKVFRQMTGRTPLEYVRDQKKRAFFGKKRSG